MALVLPTEGGPLKRAKRQSAVGLYSCFQADKKTCDTCARIRMLPMCQPCPITRHVHAMR